MKDNTSIRLSNAVKKRLEELKQYKRETYEDVIIRLLKTKGEDKRLNSAIPQTLTIQLRELFKSRNKKDIPYITFEELQFCFKEVTEEELNTAIKKLLEDGEIYEPRPSSFRWLGD